MVISNSFMDDSDLEEYTKPDGSIDWGRRSKNHFEQSMNEDKKKSLSLQEMSVFKLASQVSDSVWKIVAQWDWFSKKTLGDQIVRSADSIGANIAEGYGRYFFKEYILFLYYSRGSIYETIYWLEKAQKRKLIDLAEYQEIKEKIDQLPIEINKVIKIIKTESKKWKK